MVRIWCFHRHGWGSVPGQGTEIPQAARQGAAKTNEQKKTCPRHMRASLGCRTALQAIKFVL